ncbi:MAG TPA: hypothetical protein VHU87_14085 [Rhizomicrobium sp.]|jgi:hypothetical protein|nr:hypothetical protein [Rhizomicrobium sp.]
MQTRLHGAIVAARPSDHGRFHDQAFGFGDGGKDLCAAAGEGGGEAAVAEAVGVAGLATALTAFARFPAIYSNLRI